MRTGFVLLAVALAGVVAWLLLRDPASMDPTERSDSRATEETGAGPTLVGSAPTGAKAIPRGNLAIGGKALRSSGRVAAGALVTLSMERLGEVRVPRRPPTGRTRSRGWRRVSTASRA